MLQFSSLQWEVDSIGPGGAAGLETMALGRGGFQAGQATRSCAAFYVENVLEELDAPGEFFYENATGELYVWFNSTDERAAEFLSPALETLVLDENTELGLEGAVALAAAVPNCPRLQKLRIYECKLAGQARSTLEALERPASDPRGELNVVL